MQNDSMFERRLEQIMAIQDPAEKQAQLEALAMDYPGRIEDLQRQQEMSAKLATQPMPSGKVAGPSSNPYSTYIAASPLAMGAAGVEKFMGNRNFKKASDQMTDIRSSGEDQTQQMMSAWLQAEQADKLREEEEKRRLGYGRPLGRM